MRTLTRILTVAGIVTITTVTVAQLAPVARTGAAAGGGDVIALSLSGKVATETVDQATSAWTGDLVSLATGEVAGKLRHEITCMDVTSFPCGVFKSKDKFDLPGGTIVSEGTESIAPYAAAPPGIFHVGITPEGNSITSATGVYEGRTGRAKLKAIHDGREYPAHVTFDDVWIILLDPKG